LKRAASIDALLKRVAADVAAVRPAYEASLHEKNVRDDLRVAIKNIFENLRSCVDYMAQDIFDTHCKSSPKPDKLYFPIRKSAQDFAAVVAKAFPGLSAASPAVYALVEGVQPYRNPWLGQFNQLNNHNKHQDLVEQTRTEARQVTVSRQSGSVSWGPGVTFGRGVSVMGVPIDPTTQLPVPNAAVATSVTTWVDFRFAEVDVSVVHFVEQSVREVSSLYQELRPLI